MTRLPKQLNHKILLTDPAKVEEVFRRAPLSTPTFQEFDRSLDEKGQGEEESRPDMAIKSAFRDGLVEKLLSSEEESSSSVGSLDPLRSLLDDLLTAMRALIPNRKDLHQNILSDHVKETQTSIEVLRLAITAAEYLMQLESEARAETTRVWLAKATEFIQHDHDESRRKQTRTTMREELKFVITSLLYLLYKAELCEADKQDFYLTKVIAPHVYRNGISEERTEFVKTYGDISNEQTAPLTRSWLRQLVSKEPRGEEDSSEMQRNEQARRLVYKGWVEAILFRDAADGPLELPEVLALDAQEIQSIRHEMRQAVAGCSIALHAAAQHQSVLSSAVVPGSDLAMRRQALVDAMANKESRHVKNEDYERGVQDAAVGLARVIRNTTSESLNDESSLRHRTVAVLRSQDPVIGLLNRRVKDLVSSLLQRQASGIPREMATGHRASASGRTPGELSAFRRETIVNEFVRAGLSFYAEELTDATVHAMRVIDLCWRIHGGFLGRILVEEEGELQEQR